MTPLDPDGLSMCHRTKGIYQLWNGTGTISTAAFGDNSFSGAVNVNAGRLIMGKTNTASASGDFLNASGIDLGGGTHEMRNASY